MSVILYDRVHSVEMHQNHEKPNGLFVCVLFYFILFQNVRKLNYYLDNKKGKNPRIPQWGNRDNTTLHKK